MSPRNATTDPDTGQRLYSWKGRPLLSVTSLRPQVGVVYSLHNWIIAQNIDAALRLARLGELPEYTVEELTDPKTKKTRLADIRRPIRAAADTKRDEAASLGSAVHKAAELRVPVAMAAPDVRPFLRQFYAAERALEMETLLSEVQVWNLEAGYAGSLDLVGRVTLPTYDLMVPTERVNLLLDAKTGESIYIDHLLQTLFYAFGEFVGRDDVIDQHATDILRTAQGVGILHLRPDHWELLDLRKPSEDIYREMLLPLATVANWYHQHPSIDPFIQSRVKGAA